MEWQLWAAVFAIGLTFSVVTRVGRWLRRRRVDLPDFPQKSACAVGIPAGQNLQVWVPRGAELPTRVTRMIRVSSTQGEDVLLSLNTDAPTAAPLANLRIGGIHEGAEKVRLVEVQLGLGGDGRVRIWAKAKATGRRLTVTWLEPTGKAARSLCIPTEDDTSEERAAREDERLATSTEYDTLVYRR